MLGVEPIIWGGLVAAALTTFGFLPQVLKSWKTKSTKDLSLKMCIILFAGVILWIVYAIVDWDIPLLFANAFAFFFTGSLLLMKLKYG